MQINEPEGEDSLLSFAKTILKSLTISASQKLLLCVAWTTDDAQLLFKQLPHCFGTDVTNGTNQETRPLAQQCCCVEQYQHPFLE